MVIIDAINPTDEFLDSLISLLMSSSNITQSLELIKTSILELEGCNCMGR